MNSVCGSIQVGWPSSWGTSGEWNKNRGSLSSSNWSNWVGGSSHSRDHVPMVKIIKVIHEGVLSNGWTFGHEPHNNGANNVQIIKVIKNEPSISDNYGSGWSFSSGWA